MMCRGNYTRLFFRRNALQSAAVAVGFAVSDLDNDEGLSIFHDQVQFAQSASEITANRLQPLSQQIIVSAFFCCGAAD